MLLGSDVPCVRLGGEAPEFSALQREKGNVSIYSQFYLAQAKQLGSSWGISSRTMPVGFVMTLKAQI